LRFAFINDRRLQARLFYGGCAGRMSSGRANLAAAATAFRRLRIHFTFFIIIMLIVVVLFLPIVLAYQIWTYNLFKEKVTVADLADEEAY